MFHPKKRRRVSWHGRVVQKFKVLAWKRELDCTERREKDKFEMWKGDFSSINVLTIRFL